MFWQFILILLIFVVSALVAYAMHLSAKMHTGRGRFAATVVIAMASVFPTTFIALSQVQITDTILAVANLIITGQWEPDRHNGWVRFLDYVFIFAICYLIVSFLFRFGNRVVSTWDGPTTTVDARMLDQGRTPDLLPLGIYYIQFHLGGELDLPIDPKTLQSQYLLSPLPTDTVDWIDFSRELLLESNNELSIGDRQTSWSDEVSAWFGTFVPKYEGSKERVVAVPTHSDDRHNLQAIIREVSKSVTGDFRLYICVNSNAIVNTTITHQKVTARVLSKSFLIDDALNFRSYCDDLIDRFSNAETLGSNHSLEEMYVDPLVSVEDSGPALLDDVIADWLTTTDRTQLSIVGDFGQGKSTAILAYCARWARRRLAGNATGDRVPLLITLRGRDPGGLPHADFLATWGDKYRLPGRALLNLVKAGQAVIFFEGFDEVNNAGIRRERLKQFNTLWSYGFVGSKIVFTGRPNFFLDDEEQRRLLRIDAVAALARQPATKVAKLAFFNEQQVRSALRGFPTSISDGILARFAEDDHFRDIASRPSMLPLLAVIWPDLTLKGNPVRGLTSSTVIQTFVDFEYSRKADAVNEDLVLRQIPRESNYLKIPRRIRDFFMMTLAREMAISFTGNTISGDDFFDCVRKTLPMCEAYAASITTEDDEVDFFKRVRDLTGEVGAMEVAERIASELRITGLLVRDVARGPSHLFFPHKQFYEYYVAKFAASSVNLRLDRRTRTAFDSYMSVNRPCRMLRWEPQAARFFVEISNPRWYDIVFTTHMSILDRISLLLHLISSASASATAKKIMTIRGGISRGLPRISLSRAFRVALSALLIVVGMSTVTFIAISYPILLISVFVATAFLTASAFLTIRGIQLFQDVDLWIDLLHEKFPESASEQAARALGPITAKLVYGVRLEEEVMRNEFLRQYELAVEEKAEQEERL